MTQAGGHMVGTRKSGVHIWSARVTGTAGAGMRGRAAMAGLAGMVLLLGTTTLAGAAALMPHRATYLLSLDASRPSVKLDGANGRIDYEITGDACAGYKVKLHQANEVDTGEGAATRSDMVSSSWEDGEGKTYRFSTVNRTDGRVSGDVEAVATREADGVRVEVSKPRRDTVDLKGDILMPTQHVTKVLDAAAKGEPLLAARVFDGSDDGDKVYDTLSVIGRPSSGTLALPAGAQAALGSLPHYPVTISYFDSAGSSEKPAYVMAMTLFANGVIGDLKIDYNDFVLRGRLDTFETLAAGAPCQK